MRRPRAEAHAAFRARAVPGLRPEALRPPARSSLSARATGITGAKEARCPKGPRLGRPGRPMAAESAARLLEDAAMARREAPALPKGSADNRRNGSALRRAIPSLLGGPREDGRTRRLHKEYGRRCLRAFLIPPLQGEGGSARSAESGGVSSQVPPPGRLRRHPPRAEVGCFRLRQSKMPNSGKPEFGCGEG